jgi:Raf kinase inhibitor-like YbhB/YbcL family protein
MSPLLVIAFAPFLFVQEPTAPANVPTIEAAMAFRLESPAFRNGAAIPRKYARRGDNVSPPLTWQGAPAGTKSFIVIIADSDAPSGTFYHWAVYDIPADRSALPEDAGARTSSLNQGVNDFGDAYYDGPQPPSGVHDYHFRLAALDVAALHPGGRKRDAEIWAQARSHVLAEAEIVGTFEAR